MSWDIFRPAGSDVRSSTDRHVNGCKIEETQPSCVWLSHSQPGMPGCIVNLLPPLCFVNKECWMPTIAFSVSRFQTNCLGWYSRFRRTRLFRNNLVNPGAHPHFLQWSAVCLDPGLSMRIFLFLSQRVTSPYAKPYCRVSYCLTRDAVNVV